MTMLRSVLRRRWKAATLYSLFMTFIIAFGVQGFEHGRVNNFRDQAVQLPVVYEYENPDRFPNDFILEASDSYVTFFYPALGYAARLFPLEPLMLVLYVVGIFITVSAVFNLGETLFPNQSLGLFVVIFWMAYYPNLGGDYIHSPFITHSTMAIAFSLWALVFILRGQLWVPAAILGLTANINAMTAAFVTYMWAFALLFEWRNWTWKHFVIPVIMAITAAPILYWRLTLPFTEAVSFEQFVEVMRERLWYAIFPSETNPVLWVGFVGVQAVFFYSWRYGKSPLHKTVLRMMGGIALLCVIGFTFSEIVPVEFVIELQLIRSSWLINFWAMFYLAHMTRALIFSADFRNHVAAWGLVAALAAPRIVMAFNPYTHPAPYTLYADFTTPSIDVLSSVAAFGVTILVLLALAVALFQVQRVMSRRQPDILGRVVWWFGFAAFMFIFPLFTDPNIPDSQYKTTDDFEAAIVWARDNTSPDALFFVPPTLDSFRIEAKRAQLPDWKDGTVGIFDSAWAVKWYGYMLDFGYDPAGFKFDPLDQAAICRIVAKYQPDYLIVWNRWQIDGETAYRNDTFSALSGPDVTCPNTRIMG